MVLCVECTRKTRYLRSGYSNLAKEQTSGLWDRSFFTWVFPIFQIGFSKILQNNDVPDIDETLLGKIAGEKLQAAWKISVGPHQLLKATLRAFLWSWISAVVPRLIMSGFTFAQPFLISATVDFIARPKTTTNEKYGQALVGAYIVVYLGLTVSNLSSFSVNKKGLIKYATDFDSSILACDTPANHHDSSWSHLHDLRKHTHFEH
jgi:ATP-binding cassette subfamily C (CFTR/MRP) protein 1